MLHSTGQIMAAPPSGKTAKMSSSAVRRALTPVGIDLGTTYSSLSYLTPQGQPVTLPNDEGELATPSVVLFDRNETIVGTEALRQSITMPDRVVQQSKRFMGDRHKCWVVDGRVYRPKDIASLILKKLLHPAQELFGAVRHAVITVPAQFSELQRRDTIEAGLMAGLERVDLINEPVSAAVCYVLGEGLWFAELADDQIVLVFDLGGGTLDLSLVRYNKENVIVIATGGDLKLGGLNWNASLQDYVHERILKETGEELRLDRAGTQALSLEVEQAKRSLSSRLNSAISLQLENHRRSIPIDRETFEKIALPLTKRSEVLTQELLSSNRMGWAHVNAVLITGGASRMPMIRNMLQRISGRTLNQILSPDQSISHGAAYYAGILLTGQRPGQVELEKPASTRLAKFKQQSVSGRSLGLLVRNMQTQEREPHPLIPANTLLPCAYRQRFGTVVENQQQVDLHIIESGTSPEEPYVELGECVIDALPPGLPIGSPIEVTFRYDEEAKLYVEAIEVTSGKKADTTIHRPLVTRPSSAGESDSESEIPPLKVKRPDAKGEARVTIQSPATQSPAAVAPIKPVPLSRPLPPAPTPAAKATVTPPTPVPVPQVSLEQSERPVPLCNHCGEPLLTTDLCSSCGRPHRTPWPPAGRQESADEVNSTRTEPFLRAQRRTQGPQH